MKLISHRDRRIIKYIHVYKTIEGVSYNYKPYPQTSPPNLTDYQLKTLIEYTKEDAERLGLELRH